ncbi:MAG: SDR family oxidoreductase [Aureliella sp.]
MMTLRLKKLQDQVVVITGASSGIGLTTARMAAAKGARLVLVARNEKALRQLTDELNASGAETISVIADVGSEEAVRSVLEAALERFGRIDTWINNAGVGIYGGLLDVPTDDSRRLFDTNFWGVVYGSSAAAKYFQRRKERSPSAIINIGSEVSDRAVPLLGMYTASKHAVKGYTDALRMELEKANVPVSVTLVKPSATDTPFPEHGQNFMEAEPALPPPLYAPEVVAEVILYAAEHPVRDIYAGGRAKLHAMQGSLVPRGVDRLMEALFFDKQKSPRPANRGDDALDHPTTGLHQRGAAPQGRVFESSLYAKAAMHPWVAKLSLVCVALIVGTLAYEATQRR